MNADLSYDDFLKVDIRAGTIIDVQDFPEARRPAFKLFIDFGDDIGQLKSSAQITQNYKKEDLIGKQVMAVINFPSKQIGPLMSQCLTLGVPDQSGNVILLQPEKHVPNGARMY